MLLSMKNCICWRRGPGQVFPDARFYNPLAKTWHEIENLRTPRHGFGAVADQGKVVILVGSPSAGDDKSKIVEIYTP